MNIVDQLKRDEGVVPYVYKDSLGFDTIGVGFLVDKGKGGGLFPEEIDFILQNRINKITERLKKALSWFDGLNEARKAVLQGMAYNMGVDGLLAFKNTLALVQQGRYSEASEAMLESLWAKQVPKRAKRLSEQMDKGEFV